jgi:hypothetical protein
MCNMYLLPNHRAWINPLLIIDNRWNICYHINLGSAGEQPRQDRWNWRQGKIWAVIHGTSKRVGSISKF